MTKDKITSEAFTAGQRVAGIVLGLPYFLGLFLLMMAGHFLGTGRTEIHQMLGYLCLVVLPVASCVSAAMASFAAPSGQEQAYSKSTSTGYFIMMLVFTLLMAAIFCYGYWPFASLKSMWLSLIRSGYSDMIPLMLASAWLSSIVGSTGSVISRRSMKSRRLTHLLLFFWRFSSKPVSQILEQRSQEAKN